MSERAEDGRDTEAEPVVVGTVVTPALPASTPAPPRYLELGGQRAVAVVAVVVFHVYQFVNVHHFLYRGTPAYTLVNSLDAAVPWFFVLTAFLLFEPMARAMIGAQPQRSVREFLEHRAVRLMPVYFIAVIAVWLLRQHGLPGDWRDLVEHLTFTQVFDKKRIFYTIGPAWALSVLVFFYLMLVALNVALGRVSRLIADRRVRIAVLVCTVALLAVVSLAWKEWSFSVGHRPTTGSFTTWFGPIASLDTFAVGMAVAIGVAVRGDGRALGRRGRHLLRLAASAILVAAFTARRANAWSGVYFTAFCSVGFGCLVAAAVLGSPTDRWSRALSWRPLLWLGTISYSIYVWHEPVMLGLHGSTGLVPQAPGSFIADTVVVVVASVGAGVLSHRLVEHPTNQLRERFKPGGDRHDPQAVGAPRDDISHTNLIRGA